MTDDIWWRCEPRQQAHWDEWGEVISGYSYYLQWTEYAVVRSTPKGVWVNSGFGGTRFVRGNAIRQLCVPTKELAVRDAIKRAERHVQGCVARLRIAERLLSTAQNWRT